MKAVNLFFVILITVFLSLPLTNSTASGLTQITVTSAVEADEYIYVRVYDEDGRPWIYVYDQKGNLVNSYPEE